MFQTFLSMRRLYCFSRRMARYGVQDMLSGLPFSFLLTRPAKKKKQDLPADTVKRLAAALAENGPVFQAPARYFSLYPEITDPQRARLLACALTEMPELPRELPPGTRADFIRLLEILYTLSKKHPDILPKERVENFERIYFTKTDMRFEAADMERFRDNFYDSEYLSVLQPEWIKTTQTALAFSDTHRLCGQENTPDKNKTAADIAKVLTLMILRDGFFIIPSASFFGVGKHGRLFLKRAPDAVSFSAEQRICLSHFLNALAAQDYAQAAKALFSAGFLPALYSLLELTRLCEKTHKESEEKNIPEKAAHFISVFTAHGIDVPFAFRAAAEALAGVQRICREKLEVQDDFWQAASPEYALFNQNGAYSRQDDLSEQFKTAFQLSENHAERLAVQGKKSAPFQKDMKQIPEIIKRREIGYRFRSKKTTPFLKIFLISVPVLLALYFYLF